MKNQTIGPTFMKSDEWKELLDTRQNPIQPR